jgi:CheY-like chemotaxis protein
MAFECLLVSRDTYVVGIVNKLLDNLSISTNIYDSSSRALDHLAEGSADLVIVDCENDSSAVIASIRKVWGWRKPTVVAVSSADCPTAGADVLLPKPITPEGCAKSLRAAYSRLVLDHRRRRRYAVMSTVSAIDETGRSVEVMITDIGDGGAGLRSKQNFRSSDKLSFHVQLPGAERAIFLEVRVQWTRRYGTMGCEFLRIPPDDLKILHRWLTLKNQIKKPAAEI